ncbi:related to human ubiquitin-specific protease [Rhynchosporium secalis]|uniref:ubiquitinyl hydrolase 1 n=1 Tax=Rhynchosporium secalis TaxID=38038 RepID=A0A1E1MP64_RHYSE|nr:related to human ubiquitin-specific protease [Rhynchosporium secalis]
MESDSSGETSSFFDVAMGDLLADSNAPEPFPSYDGPFADPNSPGFQDYNATDAVNPSEMLIDSDEYMNEEDAKDDVVNIDPDQSVPRADDFEKMTELVLYPLPEQPPTLEYATSTWEIENWKELPRRARGPIFHAGGHPWRVLMFPNGNNVDYVSFYLEQAYDEAELPEDFTCCLQFGLVLWNPEAPWVYVTHTAHHRFTKEEGDWGFTRFVELRKLWAQPYDETGHYLAPGQKASMTAYVRVLKDETGVLWHNFNNYDSKKETGYVGLKNQGATCYLNSLIQSLYFTNAFRKAVYQIPTQNEETLQNSAYTLQRLFYQLQSSNNAVGTNELTKSFGWETRHIFEQQDVQELSRKLMERMEEKMKGTDAENVLSELFCGKVRTYISCINVEYESRRVEDYWDIQLNVHGNKDIEASFKDYVQVEVMNGENQYFAGDDFKLQDANKGVIFESFPDVLHLQLKRFQYDIDRDAMMKINDRYEFPETFDASAYLADDADKSESWVYQLHGVLVHHGDLNTGHYYAFIKPTKDGWFYKYDDDRVTKATLREVLEDNFGGEYIQPNGQVMKVRSKPVLRQNSAYMLVYIRQSRVDNVLLPVTEEDIPSHLQKKLEEEAALREARKKERDEQHLYINIKVITDETLERYGGTDLTNFDSSPDEDPAAPRAYRYLRKSTLGDLAKTVGEDTGVDPRRIRFWGMVNRQNKTVRPDVPLPDRLMTVDEAHSKTSNSKGSDMRLWAEVAQEVDAEGEGIWPATPGPNGAARTDLIVIFLKIFHPETQSLAGAGYIYMNRDQKVEDLVPAILKKMNWPDKLPSGERTQLRLFEEIKPTMIESMKAKQTLKAAELQDGDIVCFQLANTDNKPESDSTAQNSKPSPTNSVKNSWTTADGTLSKGSPEKYELAPMYYEFLIHRREVRFVPIDTTSGIEPFTLVLHAKYSYDNIAMRVGEQLGVDPTHIRFTTANQSSGKPKAIVKRGQNQTLQTILNPPYTAYFNQNTPRVDSLFFEVLDMSLSELDTKRSLKITWVSEGITKSDSYEVLVSKSANVEDVIAALIKKAGIDDEVKGGPIRLFEVAQHRLSRQIDRNLLVNSLSEYINIMAERVPEDEIGFEDSIDIISAFHFQGEAKNSHGIPFRFRLIPKEPFSETKKRLEKRTGLKGKNFEKIKFAVVKRSSYTKPLYIADDQILDDLITQEEDLLGLDHIDRSRSVRNGAQDLFLK